ncbi:MAG: NAD(P)/FAD-dependent oxidoreductase, partial [Methanobacterium sp.]|nr:NAD(P)/FAD-dependent oxidoreductase [Methanobacterium sp.]
KKTLTYPSPDPEKTDEVMLKRSRLSRIFYLRKFFDYPLSLNYKTFSNLGPRRTVKIGLSYFKTLFNQKKPEKSLQDFFINRFGSELYHTFFKDYTEKVWGVPCSEITAEWGSQRIKGLSIHKTITHALKKKLTRNSSLNQENIETSLINEFMYPKFGPGQLWEEVARIIEENGGEIHTNQKVIGISTQKEIISHVTVLDKSTGTNYKESADYFISTMPVQDLINSFKCKVPESVLDVANGLMYRDFITVGLLLDKLELNNETNTPTVNDIVPDNWIYIQERDVRVGRIQIFNNWSPYMVKDPSNVWIGLEYFCNEGDKLWAMSETDFQEFAADELAKIGMINPEDVKEGVVIKVKKTYPAYFGTYPKFNLIKVFTERFDNLFLIGRNGMHRYNNMDHSMLTAMAAVKNIINGDTSKKNLWQINTEEDYHEEN